MTTAAKPNRPDLSAPACVTAVLLWAGSLLVLVAADRQAPLFAFAVAAYATMLWAAGTWLLPRTVPLDDEEVLRAAGTRPRLAARCVVVLTAVAFVYAYGAALTGLETHLSLPLLTPLVERLGAFRLWPGVGGVELFKVVTYVLVPGGLLLALGARPKELGLRPPARRTTAATLVCLVPSAAFVGWGLASGRLSAASLFFLLVHNLLSNGFSEEFLCRGMVLSHLRGFLKADWALVVQAVLFALMHFQPMGAEERAAPWRSVAEDIALNMPLGLAFGYLALRSRSLALPTLLHMFRWAP